MSINLLGLLLIALIVWWFWIYQPKAIFANNNTATVIVDSGSYEPSRIQLTAGKSTTLRFLRKDASPCAETVIFENLGISEELPLNRAKDISIPPLGVGEYSFTCQMKMYRGELVVSKSSK